MLGLCDIAGPPGAPSLVPIGDLAEERGIGASKLRLLKRYFRLESVALSDRDQTGMCAEALAALVARHPDLAGNKGLLIHPRTQTHMTLPDDDWLRRMAADAGLATWETLGFGMTHCAGGLGALHLATRIAGGRPVIVLAGEKCVHASTARLSGAVLGEMPTAVLLRPGAEWRIAGTRLAHIPDFHANPDRMDAALLARFERQFGAFLEDFVTDTLVEFGTSADAVDDIVPYNLNLPLLERIADTHGWRDRMFTGTAPRIGHLFCADVFHNLGHVLPKTTGQRVLGFAAGMGASFAAVLLERRPQS